MLQPVILFAVTLAGFLLAIGYFVWTAAFSGRMVARCRIPGETTFDLDPALGPVRIAAHLGPPVANAPVVRVTLERDGRRLWTRDVLPGHSRGLLDDAVRVSHFDVDRPGRYRLRGEAGAGDRACASLQVWTRAPRPRQGVYVLAGVMLAGGFVSLLVVLAR